MALSRLRRHTSLGNQSSAPNGQPATHDGVVVSLRPPVTLSSSMASSSPRDEALAAKIKERAGPEVFCVFDLDRTLWNGDCQRFSKPAELQLYPEVPRIIEALNRCGIPWAVASANPNRERCLWLLQAHGLLAPGQGFAGIGARLERGADIAAEVFPGGKRPHLERIKRAVGRPWNSMLFFDDLPWNVQQADKLGAVGVRVEAGMTVEVLLSGLQLDARQVLGDRGGLAPASILSPSRIYGVLAGHWIHAVMFVAFHERWALIA